MNTTDLEQSCRTETAWMDFFCYCAFWKIKPRTFNLWKHFFKHLSNSKRQLDFQSITSHHCAARIYINTVYIILKTNSTGCGLFPWNTVLQEWCLAPRRWLLLDLSSGWALESSGWEQTFFFQKFSFLSHMKILFELNKHLQSYYNKCCSQCFFLPH